MAFEWDDRRKAGLDFRKHGVRMPEDGRNRGAGRLLVVVYTWRGKNIRSFPYVQPKPTSAKGTRKSDENQSDFRKGKRGRVLAPEPEAEGKTRITIRLDQDILDRFFQMAEASGGATGYQTLINAALREYRIEAERSLIKVWWPGTSLGAGSAHAYVFVTSGLSGFHNG